MRTGWAWTAATVGGVGRLRPGPGTWGSVAAVLVWMGAASLLHPARVALGVGTIVASLAALASGMPAAEIVARESGSDDPQFVVIDEVAGQWLALAGCSFARTSVEGEVLWLHALLAFGLFRLFDITKPAPARQLERLHGGAGIMLDDMAAGGYALLVMLVIGLWW